MAIEIPESAREDVLKIQQFQQQLQVLLMQKQELQVQTAEIENAAKELDKTDTTEVYEIIGNIMVKKNKEELKKSLQEKKEIIDLRIKTLNKQIDVLTKKTQEIQEKIIQLTKEKKK
jgi:prefoldin beta subunit